MKTTVYTSDKRTHFFKELVSIFQDVRKSSFLAYQMAKRDLQAQYRKSFLGFFWAFAPILTNSLVWIFLNSSGTVQVNTGQEIPYILFVVIGTTLWSIFNESLFIPMTSVNGAKGLLSKINFPKEALLIAGVYKMSFNLMLKLILIAAILIIFGILPSAEILLFPVYLMVIILFSLALGILITPIGLIYTDINRFFSTVISFGMYITPVVYAAPRKGIFKTLFDLNPLTYLFTDSRNILTGYPPEHILGMLILGIVSGLVFLIGLVIFRKSMPIIIEKISG